MTPRTHSRLFRQLPPLSGIYILATFICIHLEVFSDVHSWRNGGNGEYSMTQIPLDWKTNTRWMTPIQHRSNSCPISVGDKIIFCQEPHSLVCVDRHTGEVLWQRENSRLDQFDFKDNERDSILQLAEEADELRRTTNGIRNEYRRLQGQIERNPDDSTLKTRAAEKQKELINQRAQLAGFTGNPLYEAVRRIPTHQDNGYTSFTPVSDSTHIFAAFGNGVLVAYDLTGKKLWGKIMEDPNQATSPGGVASWGGATSPILVDGKLIVRFGDCIALDPLTGNEIWRTTSKVAYGTPAIFEIEDQPFLFTCRGRIIRVSDGKVMQSGLIKLHQRYDWTTFVTPFIKDHIAYVVRGFSYEDDEGHAYSYRIPDTLESLEHEGLELLWHNENIHKQRYYASPIVYQGLMHIFSQDHFFSVLDANTGEIIYEKELKDLDGTAYTSISLVNDTLFIGSEGGTIVAVRSGRKYTELARSHFETFRSTPIFDGETAYLRTYKHLYAIGIQ